MVAVGATLAAATAVAVGRRGRRIRRCRRLLGLGRLLGCCTWIVARDGGDAGAIRATLAGRATLTALAVGATLATLAVRAALTRAGRLAGRGRQDLHRLAALGHGVRERSLRRGRRRGRDPLEDLQMVLERLDRHIATGSERGLL